MSCIEEILYVHTQLGILPRDPSHIKGRIYTFCIVFGFNGSVADLSVRRFLLCACRFFVFASAPTARKWFWKYSSISESFLPWVSGSNSHTNTAAAIETPAKNHCTAWDPIIKIEIEKIHLELGATVYVTTLTARNQYTKLYKNIFEFSQIYQCISTEGIERTYSI